MVMPDRGRVMPASLATDGNTNAPVAKAAGDLVRAQLAHNTEKKRWRGGAPSAWQGR
jgi:microcystin degradation protein MlrC